MDINNVVNLDKLLFFIVNIIFVNCNEFNNNLTNNEPRTI